MGIVCENEYSRFDSAVGGWGDPSGVAGSALLARAIRANGVVGMALEALSSAGAVNAGGGGGTVAGRGEAWGGGSVAGRADYGGGGTVAGRGEAFGGGAPLDLPREPVVRPATITIGDAAG